MRMIALAALAAAASGCASNIPETHAARGVGVWQARLPSTPSTFEKLAYGTDGTSQPARVTDSESQPPLAAAMPAVTKPGRNHTRRATAPTMPMASARTTQPSQPEPLPAAKVTPFEQPVLLASNSEPDADQRYAEREAQTPKLQDYRGGDAIVISASALVIVLLIVILILLLR